MEAQLDLPSPEINCTFLAICTAMKNQQILLILHYKIFAIGAYFQKIEDTFIFKLA
jgi:hypothetical protein